MYRIAIICNPENRRYLYFEEAAKQLGFAAPLVLSYEELLCGKITLDQLAQEPTILRIESPGENEFVSRLLLAKGAEISSNAENEQISATEALSIKIEKGEIRFLRQQHLGFEKLLGELDSFIKASPMIFAMNSPEAIRCCFDKVACHQLLQEAGIPLPAALYNISSYKELKKEMLRNKWSQVFIKPVNGSSASGVVAFRFDGKQQLAYSSAEIVKDEKEEFRFYNSLKVRKYEKEEDIKQLLSFLIKEKVIVEKWIPKATNGIAVFDFRIVVIAGKATHFVLRESESPMTNLHLGNKRGDLENLKERIGAELWDKLCRVAEKAVKSVPGLFYAGVDLMISADFKNVYVLELNAFGDLLPNVLCDGLDTYSLELKVIGDCNSII